MEQRLILRYKKGAKVKVLEFMFYKMVSIFYISLVLSVTKIECLGEIEFRNEQPRTLNLVKKDVSSWILGKICYISG